MLAIRIISSLTVALLTLEISSQLDSRLASVGGKEVRCEGTYRDSVKRDDLFGFRSPQGTRESEKCSIGGKVAYDVHYSFDGDGLRITPDAPDAASSILFFGDSFTFGIGLDDNQTVPYQVATMSGNRYRVYNFAVPGYGPNHMLAAIDCGMIRRIVSKPPVVAIYGLTSGAIQRALGLNEGYPPGYKPHTPRYVKGAKGEVVLSGHFDDHPGSFSVRIDSWLNQSQIFERVWGDRRPLWPGDNEFLGLMVRASAERLRSLFPACTFEVMVLSPDGFAGQVAAIRRQGITVRVLDDFLPGWSEDWDGLRLKDGHPNAEANRLTAEYILKEIVKNARN